MLLISTLGCQKLFFTPFEISNTQLTNPGPAPAREMCREERGGRGETVREMCQVGKGEKK